MTQHTLLINTSISKLLQKLSNTRDIFPLTAIGSHVYVNLAPHLRKEVEAASCSVKMVWAEI